MLSYDSAIRLVTGPADPEAHSRAARLRQLGIGFEFPDVSFDEFSSRVAQITGAPYAMINFIDEFRQYFAGMYVPTAPEVEQITVSPARAAGTPEPARVMDRDHGYCPHVVVRHKALVLEDVCDYPRFNGDPVMDDIGIRSYMGAPVVDKSTGMTLGTVCAADLDPHPWGRPGLETIKAMAAEVSDHIYRREQRMITGGE